MSIFVVDASVAIKWFIPEIHGDTALRLHAPGNVLHVPNFLSLEIGNVLCKKQRQTELTREEALLILRLLQKLPLHWHPDDILFHGAFSLASETRRSLYDCMYLSLAALVDGLLITADRKFYDALQDTSHGKRLMWVEDLR
uniref:PIN domain-containing protein n=1 Tax=Candidatus Kentrum sp. DK TaxID=2126562 RepID=A0A450ST84_9GAMM|nr:MAG: hypothetical protein BECKDK2373B_GA0170837_106318 [Candidatus Kentron sp. DK]